MPIFLNDVGTSGLWSQQQKLIAIEMELYKKGEVRLYFLCCIIVQLLSVAIYTVHCGFCILLKFLFICPSDTECGH